VTNERRVDNFGAGPGALPVVALERAQVELLNFQESGMSVLEISHRDSKYEAVQARSEELLRTLLSIPDDYSVLFIQGGASLQFAMVPYNFLPANGVARYVVTGTWAEKALEEAVKIGQAKVAASGKGAAYRRIPAHAEIEVESSDAYLHITSNNTIVGTQWQTFPDVMVPLVADMSSDILSRPLDVSKFDCIYAGAQKNLGPAGVTVVIARTSWLNPAPQQLPSMLQYATHAKAKSLYNTPPTFSIYMLSLVLEWIQDMGGVTAMAERNERKAKLLYDCIDGSAGYYEGVADLECRSRMNVTFRLPTPALEQAFLAAASVAGFVGLAGHRSVGGCRASIYNAVEVAAVERLVTFMDDFRRNDG